MRRTGVTVYVLACRDGSFYTGWTGNLTHRMAQHVRGRGAKYVRSRRPFALALWWPVRSVSDALRLEVAFKRLKRTQKLDVVEGRSTFRERAPRRAPLLAAAAERSAMNRTAPAGDELQTLVEEARSSQVRLHTNKGDIVFVFYPDDAPQHCAAFIKLARSGFYDGLTFHRVEPRFVVQGGDPDGTGTGGPGYRLDAEFSDRPHVRGTVAMARSSNPNSAGSQFYICLDDARFLDKQYTVFGQTREGLEVLDKIRVGDRMESVTVQPLPSADH